MGNGIWANFHCIKWDLGHWDWDLGKIGAKNRLGDGIGQNLGWEMDLLMALYLTPPLRTV